MPKVTKKIRQMVREKILKTKWKSLRKRGYTSPKDAEENRRRAKEAHGY